MFDFLFRRNTSPLSGNAGSATPPAPRVPAAPASAPLANPPAGSAAPVTPDVLAAREGLHAGQYDAGPGTHPLVQKIVDEPAAPAHLQQLDEAKAAVMDENRQRGLEAAAQMAVPRPEQEATVVQTLILGGGTHATLDAATLPPEIQSAVGVSMGPDPWSRYGHLRFGQTGNELLPHQPGDPTQAKPGLAGMPVHPAQLSPDPQGEFLRSSELSLATAEAQRQSGVPFVAGQPIGPIQLRPDDPSQAADWPPNAKAKVTIKTMIPDPSDPEGKKMKEHVETVFTTETVDVAVGPGPARKLGDDQIQQRDKLESWGTDADGQPVPPQVQYAEEFLQTPAAAQDKKVLVYGGGDTAAWAAEGAKGQGAASIDWRARAGKPSTETQKPDGTKEPTEFGLAEKAIREAALRGEPPPPEAQEKYRAAMAQYAADLQPKIAEAEREVRELRGKGTAVDPKTLADAEEKLGRLKSQVDPFAPEIRKPRNKEIYEDPGIAKRTGEIIDTRPDPNGSGKVQVKMIMPDGTVTTELYDKVVGAIGQDREAAAGPAKLCEKIEQMRVIWSEDGKTPLGLESAPPGVRVLGAAAWMLQHKLPPTEQKSYYLAIRERSQGQVSTNSRGVDLGFEVMGDNAAGANDNLGKKLRERPLAPGEDVAGEEAAEDLARRSPPPAT